MPNLTKISQLVTQAYRNSTQDFAHWSLENHLTIVANKTEQLSERFGANKDIAVAGAWLHDFGDAFVHRHSKNHEEVSETEAIKILKAAEYSPEQITQIIEQVIAPHSCKDGFLPTTLEGKVLATADALAHLTTDFYLQFAWKHLPENKTYPEYVEWVQKKLNQDFTNKIFFDEVKEEVKPRYEALKEIFLSNQVKSGYNEPTSVTFPSSS